MLFKNDKPILPFIYHELSRLLGLVFRKKKLDEAKTLTKIMTEDRLNNPDNQMEEFLIDVGQHVLSSVKVSVKKKRKFLKKCIIFVLYIFLMLQERLPTQYAIVRNVSAISPVNMAQENRCMSRKFLRLASYLHYLKFIASSMADNAKFQYEFVKKIVPKNRDKFLEFDMRKERVDEFLSAYAGTCPKYKDVRSVCKLVFTLSHDQTFFERGFSINKAISYTNLQEEALGSQRQSGKEI